MMMPHTVLEINNHGHTMWSNCLTHRFFAIFLLLESELRQALRNNYSVSARSVYAWQAATRRVCKAPDA